MSIFDYDTIIERISVFAGIFELEALYMSSRFCKQVIDECTPKLAERQYLRTKNFPLYKKLYCSWYYQGNLKESRIIEKEVQAYENGILLTQSWESKSDSLNLRLMDAHIAVHKAPVNDNLLLKQWMRRRPLEMIRAVIAQNKEPFVLGALISAEREDILPYFRKEIRKLRSRDLKLYLEDTTLRIRYAFDRTFFRRKPTLTVITDSDGFKRARIKRIDAKRYSVFDSTGLIGFATSSSSRVEPAEEDQKILFDNIISNYQLSPIPLVFEDPPEDWIRKEGSQINWIRSGRFDLYRAKAPNRFIRYKYLLALTQNKDLIDDWNKHRTCQDRLVLYTPELLDYAYSCFGSLDSRIHVTLNTDSLLALHIQVKHFDRSDEAKNTKIILGAIAYRRSDFIIVLCDALDADYNAIFLKALENREFAVCSYLLEQNKVQKSVLLTQLKDSPALAIYKLLLT